jgi:hypothetical protein
MKDLVQISRLQPDLGLQIVPIGFEGIGRLKKICADFNWVEDTWESYQAKLFNEQYCNVLIREILGADCERCIEMVMTRNGWKKIHDEVLLLAQRTAGKTRVLIAALAVFFVNVPNFSACVYAGTKSKGNDFYRGIVIQVQRLLSRYNNIGAMKNLVITADGMTWTVSEDDVRWIRPFSTFGIVRRLCCCCSCCRRSFWFLFCILYRWTTWGGHALSI